MSVLEMLPKKKKKVTRVAAYKPVVVPHFSPKMYPSNHPLPVRLTKKLADLRSKYRFVRVAERVAQAIVVAVLLLTVQMFLDWLVDLPFVVRLLLLAGDITLLVFFVRKYVLPVLRPLNQEACALLVEKKWPKFSGRMIAAVQFAGPSLTADSPGLISALQQEAEARTISLNFNDIVPTKPLQRRTGLALLLVALLAGAMWFFGAGSLALLERVFLLPAKVPRKTEVICISKDMVVPAGDSVLLEAQAKGIVPSHGRVTLVDNTGKIQEITIDPEHDRPDYFSLKIERIEQPMSYTIRLNDGSSGEYHVKTVPRPNATTIDCEQIYPAYTGLPPVKRTVGNLALLAGSRLKIHATANSKITKATLKLVGPDNKVLPVTVGGADSNDLTGEIPIPAEGLTGFSLMLTNQAGITSGDETQYQIDLIPDRAPTVQQNSPEKLEELYTIKAKPVIVYQASDDYGLAKVSLCYRVVQDQDTAPVLDANGNPPPPPEPKRIEMKLGDGKPLTLQQSYTWDLASIQPPVTEGTSLEYWIEARDANDVTGPGIGETEHHVIKIVSDAEKKAEVMNDLLDALSQVQDISVKQDNANTQLGKVIQGKTDKK